MGRVDESLRPERVRQDRGGRAGLRRVPRGVLWEVGRRQERRPCRVDHLLDIGDRSEHVVNVFRVPAGDEGVGHGDPHSRVGLGGVAKSQGLVACELPHDRDPVPWRGPGRAGTVGPVPGDRDLLGREVLPRVVDLLAKGIELRGRILRIGGRWIGRALGFGGQNERTQLPPARLEGRGECGRRGHPEPGAGRWREGAIVQNRIAVARSPSRNSRCDVPTPGDRAVIDGPGDAGLSLELPSKVLLEGVDRVQRRLRGRWQEVPGDGGNCAVRRRRPVILLLELRLWERGEAVELARQ